ncbi:ankyrin repeat domain-containing protein 13D isoform X1 [Pararge aegeria]|uniref:ankyrin repeat domain-containing protein 13D isoform X1 n=1 Tax=Pararge aegeria TaxID=116150 RepID=UPI0019D194E0|nr:ankyrin repeat domain-containing protein 13D isoform X1 [Pararge aegeria]
MSLTSEDVSSRYPIHWLVWNNKHEELKNALQANKYSQEDIERHDNRGRTPLLLAVTLGHLETVQALIEANADINCEKDGWTAVQEATATGNPELLALVLSRRDYQRHVVQSSGTPELLNKLSLAPDFYVEMKWEFTSWVPLVSRMCPFDTYKVYKRGANVRVDTTLVGFENNRWQRGDRTYIFRGQGSTASLVELDHEAGTSSCEYFEVGGERGARGWPPPPPHVIDQRMGAPLAINYLDTDKISFERNKSGIWGWRQDKTESVNSYECKVFSANNVELVSKTRSEHLPKGEKRAHTPRAPLAGLLALADNDDTTPSTPVSPLLTPDREEPPKRSRSREDLRPVTWEEYFSDEPLDRDIGRPRDIATKVQKFRATLWLCEDYPLELQEQIMPILDLMASISSPHFAKLKDFIQMQLPAGFPVKIEIPLFHVLNARITFGNIFATETPVTHVECIQEGERLSCVVDDQCFSLGRGYADATATDERLSCDDDEGLLQYAIQQSLMEAGTHDDQVDVWEALRGARSTSPVPPRARLTPSHPLLEHEDTHLQRAIEASLSSAPADVCLPDADALLDADADADADELDADLRAALAMSAREQAALDRQLQDEQKALDEVLRLSLMDK